MTTTTTSSAGARIDRRALAACSFNDAKIPGKGEDADPLAHIEGDGTAFLGVFDGLGGSGCLRCGGADGVHTSAYYGARVARASTEAFLRRTAAFADVTPDALAAVLTEHLAKDLRTYDARWGAVASSALRSTLFRRLPTTAAVAIVRPRRDTARVQVLWAGDSRCYTLSPSSGLQQLTVDHLRSPGDAFANLAGDSSISNCISADEAFHIVGVEVELPMPCIVLAATDGCFGYVPTPMHFEALLLDALMSTRSIGRWLEDARRRISAIAADDASLTAVTVGWSKHRALRRAFADRARFLNETYIAPLAAVDTTAARGELWRRYAPTYEALLPKEVACTTR